MLPNFPSFNSHSVFPNYTTYFNNSTSNACKISFRLQPQPFSLQFTERYTSEMPRVNLLLEKSTTFSC